MYISFIAVFFIGIGLIIYVIWYSFIIAFKFVRSIDELTEFISSIDYHNLEDPNYYEQK